MQKLRSTFKASSEDLSGTVGALARHCRDSCASSFVHMGSTVRARAEKRQVISAAASWLLRISVGACVQELLGAYAALSRIQCSRVQAPAKDRQDTSSVGVSKLLAVYIMAFESTSAYVQAWLRACMQAWFRACIQACLRVSLLACMRSGMLPCMRACVQECLVQTCLHEGVQECLRSSVLA